MALRFLSSVQDGGRLYNIHCDEPWVILFTLLKRSSRFLFWQAFLFFGLGQPAAYLAQI
jgi:hypothetical protein